MADFFDWLTAVDSGRGTDRLRERFKLSEAEMRRATEALAPAFLIALQQMAANRDVWAKFMSGAATAGLPGSQPNPTPFGVPGDFAASLFGSKALADSVTRQASAMAGIAPDTLSKMMPELGLMALRTMMQMVGPGMPQPGAMPGDFGGQAVAEMMRRSANAVEAMNRPSSQSPLSSAHQPQAVIESLFADALKGGFPWMAGAGSQGSPASSGTQRSRTTGDDTPGLSPFFAFAPLLDAIAGRGDPQPTGGERVGGANASQAASADQKPETIDLFAGMTHAMESGRSLQETYAQEMLALFNRHRTAD